MRMLVLLVLADGRRNVSVYLQAYNELNRVNTGQAVSASPSRRFEMGANLSF